ncbi:MAG: hypothetical protein Kilf2KO_08830 [Rhodospirillales bacterium]
MTQIFRAAGLAVGLLFLALTGLPAQAADTTVAQGTFTGASDHITTGGVSIVTTPEGSFVVLAEDFSLDGAPDPHVALGKDGTYDASTRAGLLKSNSGAGRYKLPEGVDPSAFNEVYIWCVKYSVPLGVAQVQ